MHKFMKIIVCLLSIQTSVLYSNPTEKLSGVSDQEITDRIQYIDASLKGGEVGSRVWYWTFLGLYTAGTAVQLSLYFTAPTIHSDATKLEYFRQDMMVSSITTAIGVINLAISPMTSMYARNSFTAMPEGSHEDKVLKLKKARKCS